MVAVDAFDGIKYGFRIILYFLAVIIIGLIVSSVGIGIVSSATGGPFGQTDTGQLLIGGVVALSGILTIYAGALGALYKVIADAVEQGNQAAS